MTFLSQKSIESIITGTVITVVSTIILTAFGLVGKFVWDAAENQNKRFNSLDQKLTAYIKGVEDYAEQNNKVIEKALMIAQENSEDHKELKSWVKNLQLQHNTLGDKIGNIQLSLPSSPLSFNQNYQYESKAPTLIKSNTVKFNQVKEELEKSQKILDSIE